MNTHTISTLAAVSLASVCFAQQTDDSANQKSGDKMKKQPRYVALEDMLDAHAGLKGGEKAKGRVKDLIIDPKSGAVRWAVLDVGPLVEAENKHVAMPMAALDCEPQDMDDAKIAIRAAQETLRELPAFDIEKAATGGLVPAMQTVEAAWVAVRKDAEDAGEEEQHDDPDVVVRGAAVSATPMLYVRAKKLGDWTVRASDGELGAVTRTLVCVDRPPTIEYVVIRAGEAERLVPFAALSIAKHEDGPAWTIAKTTAEMQKAPKYEKPAKGMLAREACERAHEFFGVETTQKDEPQKEQKERSKQKTAR